jgi:hypothetical protein
MIWIYLLGAVLPLLVCWLAAELMHLEPVDTRRGAGTGFEWLDSRSAFESGRWRHDRAWLALSLIGRRRRLTLPVLSQPSGPTGLLFAGEQTVPLGEIVGSVDGGRHSFDRHFDPTADDAWPRYRAVFAARSLDVSLPPVSLYQASDGYYVLDGHHRVAVARALGDRTIRAEVTIVEDEVPREPATLPTTVQPATRPGPARAAVTPGACCA